MHVFASIKLHIEKVLAIQQQLTKEILITPMASSLSSILNKDRNNYDLELQMKQASQNEGGCLARRHISILLEKVHLDLRQNDFIEMVSISEQ